MAGLYNSVWYAGLGWGLGVRDQTWKSRALGYWQVVDLRDVGDVGEDVPVVGSNPVYTLIGVRPILYNLPEVPNVPNVHTEGCL